MSQILNIECPSCKTVLEMEGAEQDWAGKSLKCPECKTSINIPKVDQPPLTSSFPKCPSCNKEMPPNAVLCVSRGFDLRTGKRLQSVDTLKPNEFPKKDNRKVRAGREIKSCRTCGEEIFADTLICTKCYTNQETGKQDRTQFLPNGLRGGRSGVIGEYQYYSDVPWYRKNWFAILCAVIPLVYPIMLILLLTGNIYYEKHGKLRKYNIAAKIFLIIWSLLLVYLLIMHVVCPPSAVVQKSNAVIGHELSSHNKTENNVSMQKNEDEILLRSIANEVRHQIGRQTTTYWSEDDYYYFVKASYLIMGKERSAEYVSDFGIQEAVHNLTLHLKYEPIKGRQFDEERIDSCNTHFYLRMMNLNVSLSEDFYNNLFKVIRKMIELGWHGGFETPAQKEARERQEQDRLKEEQIKKEQAMEVERKKQQEAVEEVRIRQEQEVARRESRLVELKTTYLKSFQSPIGKEVTLSLKTGAKMQGVVSVINSSSVLFKVGNAQITFEKENLSKESLILCYAPEYADAMARRRLANEINTGGGQTTRSYSSPLPQSSICSICNGSGKIVANRTVRCRSCSGTGQKEGLKSKNTSSLTCTTCNGSGQVVENISGYCPSCRGTGRISE